MGWMEILAALQKAVPLLTRAVPMLEVFVASRNNSAANEELRGSLTGLSAEIKNESSRTRALHQEVSDQIAANIERLGHISADLARLQSMAEAQNARSAVTEEMIGSLVRTLRILFVLTGLIVLLCIAIVMALLLRHA